MRFPDEPRGTGFRLAHEVYGSRVERVVCNIYDADPADLGTFDLVFCGMVLIHLRDQLLALERIARLCRGTFITAEEPAGRSARRVMVERDRKRKPMCPWRVRTGRCRGRGVGGEHAYR